MTTQKKTLKTELEQLENAEKKTLENAKKKRENLQKRIGKIVLKIFPEKEFYADLESNLLRLKNAEKTAGQNAISEVQKSTSETQNVPSENGEFHVQNSLHEQRESWT